jgi:hypothetical protein
MNAKDEKPTGIPIAEFLKGDDNKRNLKMFMREPHSDPLAREALMDELWKLRDDEQRRADEEQQRVAPFRRSGPRGPRAPTQYIHKLVAENPGLRPKELFRIAQKSRIPDMTFGTFRNHVGKAPKD